MSGALGFSGDQHGRPSEVGNDHLTEEQRADLTRRGDKVAARRGRHQAIVVVDVYESGEAVPQVQFPHESSLDKLDEVAVGEAVARAAQALHDWR